jgi:hypothetical protein
VKWLKFTIHEKTDRIKITIFLVGLSGIFIYTMGIDDFISLLGTAALIGGIIYLFNEVKSWFTK